MPGTRAMLMVSGVALCQTRSLVPGVPKEVCDGVKHAAVPWGQVISTGLLHTATSSSSKPMTDHLCCASGRRSAETPHGAGTLSWHCVPRCVDTGHAAGVAQTKLYLHSGFSPVYWGRPGVSHDAAAI